MQYSQDDLTIHMDFIKWSNPDPNFLKKLYLLLQTKQTQIHSLGREYVEQQLFYKCRADFRLDTGLNIFERYHVTEGSLELNNISDVLTISGCEFENAGIFSDVADLTITDTKFISGGIFGFYGNYTISDCEFNESFAYFFNGTYSNSKVSISNGCTFINAPINVITIDG